MYSNFVIFRHVDDAVNEEEDTNQPNIAPEAQVPKLLPPCGLKGLRAELIIPEKVIQEVAVSCRILP